MTVVTLGPPEAEEQLRDALALGADRAILLETDGSDWDPEATAAALVEVIAGESPDLVIFGNESADAGGYQVGIRVAHALGRPVVTGLKALAVEDGEVRGQQETGDVYRVPLPAVVTVKEGINLPRYPSVPAKLRARKKPIERREPARRDARVELVRLVVPGGPRAAGGGARRGPGRRSRRRRAVPAAGGRVSVLVFVEDADELALQALTFARAYDGDVDAIAFGEAPAITGVRTLHVADVDGYAPQAWARAIAQLSPTTVVAAGTDRGNEVLAHAAVMTGGVFAANCVSASGDEVVRQRWGGSLLEEARLHGDVKLMTVAPHAVAPETVAGEPAVESFTPELRDEDLVARVVERVDTSTGGLSLAEAPVVVSRRARASARPRASSRWRSWPGCSAASSAARGR